jgi:hypothetical protein
MDHNKERKKECNKHERKPGEEDVLKICETCGSHFYACELCRNTKEIPKHICKAFLYFFYKFTRLKWPLTLK